MLDNTTKYLWRSRMRNENYLKVWRDANGVTPKGNEIHHVDGDHSNNELSNLRMLTIQEHYDVHESQGDLGACFLISKRMDMSEEERSRLASGWGTYTKDSQLGIFSQTTEQRKVSASLGGNACKDKGVGIFSMSTTELSLLGTDRFEEKSGIHTLDDSKRREWAVLGAKATTKKLLSEGRHISQTTFHCDQCDRSGKGPRFKGNHFNNCKQRLEG
jgi:hypothetical protein